MGGVPIAPMKRIIRRAGAARVSTEAAKALAEALEKIADDLAAEAVAVAKHAGRRPISL